MIASSALTALIDEFLDAAKRERADDWCNTEDKMIWRAIHQARARVYDECTLKLQALAAVPGQAKETNPCPTCGTFLWGDPRPCWNCARQKAVPGQAPWLEGNSNALHPLHEQQEAQTPEAGREGRPTTRIGDPSRSLSGLREGDQGLDVQSAAAHSLVPRIDQGAAPGQALPSVLNRLIDAGAALSSELWHTYAHVSERVNPLYQEWDAAVAATLEGGGQALPSDIYEVTSQAPYAMTTENQPAGETVFSTMTATGNPASAAPGTTQTYDKYFGGQALPLDQVAYRLQGRCPSCGSASLFVGTGGYVTCSVIGCKHPSAPHEALRKAEGGQAPPSPPPAALDLAWMKQRLSRPDKWFKRSHIAALIAEVERLRGEVQEMHTLLADRNVEGICDAAKVVALLQQRDEITALRQVIDDQAKRAAPSKGSAT